MFFPIDIKYSHVFPLLDLEKIICGTSIKDARFSIGYEVGFPLKTTLKTTIQGMYGGLKAKRKRTSLTDVPLFV